ncbi:MAG: pyridoxal phosphate-dependent class II aminotransferase [Actinomycetota bacterium]|nr:pyridoxal phosphate-dependent class II aminotransferase [Actinomycetota bacterium]
MNNFSHGGNLREAQDKYGICKKMMVDFSASINPLGLSPGIKKLIFYSIDNIVNYSDPDNKLLAAALSDELKIGVKNIMIGNGSNELIYFLLNSFHPRSVIIPVPSYSEYERASLAAGSCCLFSNLFSRGKNNFTLKNIIKDLDGTSGFLIICNPNNPTGNLWDKEELEYLIGKCQKTNTIILVDEVFMPFVLDEERYSVVNLIQSYNNLAVLRSMTKIHAIPGLRLGYLLGNQALISKTRLKQPNWQVNSLAQDLGPYLLRDKRYLSKSKVLVSKLKDLFYKELNKFDWIYPYYPSVNFIFCKLKDSVTDSEELSNYLARKHSILIRDCSNFRELDRSYIRLAVKSRKENLKLIRCLEKFGRRL